MHPHPRVTKLQVGDRVAALVCGGGPLPIIKLSSGLTKFGNNRRSQRARSILVSTDRLLNNLDNFLTSLAHTALIHSVRSDAAQPYRKKLR
jgi:hypothetical protein